MTVDLNKDNLVAQCCLFLVSVSLTCDYSRVYIAQRAIYAHHCSLLYVQVQLLISWVLNGWQGRFKWRCVTEYTEIMSTVYYKTFPTWFDFVSRRSQRMFTLTQFIRNVIQFSTRYKFSFQRNAKLITFSDISEASLYKISLLNNYYLLLGCSSLVIILLENCQSRMMGKSKVVLKIYFHWKV
jgi:hypothetical protein